MLHSLTRSLGSHEMVLAWIGETLDVRETLIPWLSGFQDKNQSVDAKTNLTRGAKLNSNPLLLKRV